MNASDSLELEKLKRDKKKAERKDNLKEVSQLCNVIGQLLAKNGLFQEAICEHEQELLLSEAYEDCMGSAIACRKIGECCSEQGDFKKAFIHLNRYLESAKACSDLVEEQRSWATLGRTFLLQSESVKNKVSSSEASKEAEKAFMKGLEVCERLKSTIKTTEYMQMKARLQLNLGLVYDGRDEIRNSSDYIKQAIDKTQKFGFYDDLYRCQFTLSGMYQKHGNLSQAIRLIEEAQRAAKKLKDKQLESEALLQKALLFTQLGDYSSARRALKIANKLGDATLPVQLQIQRSYNAVVQMEELVDDLETISPEDHTERATVYEKLGDIAASIDLFKQAIEFYQKLLSCAELEGRDAAGMIPVFVSLAHTYADDKQFNRAIEFYHRELGCQQDNHEQCCRTLLNIAEAEEASDLDYDSIKKTYVAAFECARKEKHRKLQVECLNSLTELQRAHHQMNHLRQTQSKLEAIRMKYNISCGEEEEDSQDRQDTEEISNRPISDLSESDEEYGAQSTTENNTTSRGVGRRFTALSTKRNEKGETPLHRACIEGNLRKVKKLVEQGQPVNPRDFCGWLPLHEAANHDHPDIVEYLICHGSWVNDRGGEHCGGVTPLLDAANCGNLDTMRVLIEHGANVLAKDDEGSTVLECLEAWRERTNDTLSSEDREKCERMEKLLLKKTGMREKSRERGRRRQTNSTSDVDEPYKSPVTMATGELELPSISPPPRESEQRTLPQKHRSVRHSLEDTDSDSDIEACLINTKKENTSSATDTYKTAMAAVGSSALRIQSQITNHQTNNNQMTYSSNERAALIDADSNIGDEWLIEDVRGTSSKRKRPEVDKLISTQDTYHTRKRKKYSNVAVNVENVRPILLESTVMSEDDSNGSVEIEVTLSQEVKQSSLTGSRSLGRKHLGRVQKSRQLKLTSILSNSTGPVQPTVNESSHGDLPGDITGELRSVSNPAGPGGSFISHSLPAAMKIKVRVKDKLLLIPVPTSETSRSISWLAEETCQRYYNLYGVRPVIQLSTRDGAVLSPNDLISLVLTTGEELMGEVDNWELPPLDKRYSQACQTLRTVVYRNIHTCLEKCNETGHLSLTGLALHLPVLQPVLRALQCQYNLKQLHLPENRLGDSGVRSLSQILDTLPNLSTLDLSGNQITGVGINHFTEALQKSLTNYTTQQHKPLQILSSLNLSHNPLGDGCIQAVVSLLKLLPLIELLNIASCSLTQHFFQNHRILLAETLKGSTLRTLDVSFNMLGSTGVELLLWCLNPCQITGLSLRATVTSRTTNHISKHIDNYTAKTGCVLAFLDLSDCQLSAEDLLPLLRFLEPRIPLQHLVLNNNRRLDNEACREILQTSYDLSSVLERLEMRGCGVVSPLSSQFIDTLSDKLNGDSPLISLLFSCDKLDKIDKESLEQVWRDKWLEEAVCVTQGNQIHLHVNTHTLAPL